MISNIIHLYTSVCHFWMSFYSNNVLDSLYANKYFVSIILTFYFCSIGIFSFSLASKRVNFSNFFEAIFVSSIIAVVFYGFGGVIFPIVFLIISCISPILVPITTGYLMGLLCKKKETPVRVGSKEAKDLEENTSSSVIEWEEQFAKVKNNA